MEHQHLATGLSQLDEMKSGKNCNGRWEDEATSFFSTSGLSFESMEASTSDDVGLASTIETDGEILSQFYDHSFAIHENVASSQIDVQDLENRAAADLTLATDTSFLTSTTGSYSFGSPASPSCVTKPLPTIRRLTSLKDIPNASYINSISPQTMTVDLIVGIISIPAPQFIKTRRGGLEVELVEMIVGDETRAGFGINFWLPPRHDAKGRSPLKNELRKALENLRLQDVVLMRNVALSTFRGKVYGQSLRKDMTKLDLLYRNLAGLDDKDSVYKPDFSIDRNKTDPHVIKARGVQEWVMQFVGSTRKPETVTRKGPQKQTLPPDTQ